MYGCLKYNKYKGKPVTQNQASAAQVIVVEGNLVKEQRL